MPPLIDSTALTAALTAPEGALDAAMQRWWQAQQPARSEQTAVQTLAVAFSGGADSTALLLAALRLGLYQRHLAGQKKKGVYGFYRFPIGGFRVIALHIHHGLQTAADAFATHAQALCWHGQQCVQTLQQLDADTQAQQSDTVSLACLVRHVQITPGKGESVEEQARQARYQALAAMAAEVGANHVLLAHHADDQAESVLLALSRGAGVAGLAGMGVDFVRHGVRFARPLLGMSGADLRDWLRQQGVVWIDDPSNADVRFTRNHIRHQLLPVLEQIAPAFRTSLARSARLAAEADELLRELAVADLVQTGQPPCIRALQRLSRSRQANVLRYWLKSQFGAIGSEAQMQALLDVLAACHTRGHRIHIKVGRGYVERVDDVLVWQPLGMG